MAREKKLILVVDDERDLLLIIKTTLLNEGFDVVTATNGSDALAIAQEELPDLVLLDVMMPEMSGFDVLRQLRGAEKTEHIPVIMLTGVTDKTRVREAIDSGTEYYITKPFDFIDLMAKVKLAISDQESRSD